MAEIRHEEADLGDEDQVSDRNLQIKIKDREELKNLRVVFGTYEGRAFAWNLLKYCHLYNAPPVDQSDIGRFEGHRDVGLMIVGKCFTCGPDVFNLVQQEGQKRDAEEIEWQTQTQEQS